MLDWVVYQPGGIGDTDQVSSQARKRIADPSMRSNPVQDGTSAPLVLDPRH